VASLHSKLAGAAVLVFLATGCGSSAAPENGRILAWRWSGALYAMNADGSGRRKVAEAPTGSYGALRVEAWVFYTKAVPVTTPKVSYIRSELWKMRADGTGKRLVARNVSLEALSPDGRTIAFSEDACMTAGYDTACYEAVRNPTELYTIGIDGRHRRRLTHNTGYDGDPSWSPDGRSIAFATDTGVRIMGRDGRNVRYLTGGDVSTVPAWSPRGDRLLVTGFRHWRVVSTDGDTLSVLKPGPPGPKWGPVWSPDGRWIAYVGERAKAWSAEDPLQIWVMKADGTGRHPITRSVGWAVASWLPAS
jgi:Tol biopolymer transport system component